MRALFEMYRVSKKVDPFKFKLVLHVPIEIPYTVSLSYFVP